jgi:hypothetical protein
MFNRMDVNAIGDYWAGGEVASQVNCSISILSFDTRDHLPI